MSTVFFTPFLFNPVIKKFALFDLDDTLITPKSGAPFAKDEDDYIILPGVKDFISKIKVDHIIAVFSNKNYEGKKLNTHLNIALKVAKELDIPVFCATAADEYRKPNIGMFNIFMSMIKVTEFDEMFYCGDNYNGDDAGFATNIGADFYLPNQLFHQTEVKVNEIELKYQLKCQYYIMVGAPASGKNTFIEANMTDFVSASNDDFGAKEARTIEYARGAIAAGKKVVINNTNGTLEKRKMWLSMFPPGKVGCIWLTADRSVTIPRDAVREKHVGKIAIYKYYKHFVEPTSAEGFSEIIKI